MGFLSRILGSGDKPKIVPEEVTDQTFREQVVESDLPVLLFVWSSTCPHCRKVAPNIAGVANAYPDRVKVFHMNSGNAPRAASSLNVRSVPTVILIHQGKEVERFVGFRLQQYYQEAIEALFPAENPET